MIYSRPELPALIASLERGGGTELRFFEAMQMRRNEWPRWLIDISHASRHQDNNGVDAIATLDVGVVEIQIKTSHKGRLEHEKSYGYIHVVVVIHPSMTSLQIQDKVVELLFQRRGALLIPRRKKKKGARR